MAQHHQQRRDIFYQSGALKITYKVSLVKKYPWTIFCPGHTFFYRFQGYKKLAEGLRTAMRQKGRIESQLNHELPGRYENTTGPPAWASENRPDRAGQDRLGKDRNSHQLVSTAGSGYTSSYLGQNINVRPYAIALYPFCAQVKPLSFYAICF